MAQKKTTALVPTRKSLETIKAEVNKTLGAQVIISGSELKDREIIRCTSGLPALDVALGGGWAMNQWHEVVGNASDGKTTLLLQTLGANQALDPKFHCLWVSAEGFEPSWAANFKGVDLDRVTVVETNVMELAYTIVLEALDNRAVDMIVIDSLPAMVSEEEEQKAMDEFVVGVGPRLTNKFLRKSGKAQKRSQTEEDRPCIGFIVNQWREKIGVMYGDNRTTPGGRMKDYHYYTRVEIKRDEWIETKKDGKVGQAIAMRTIKNKSYKPQQQCVVDFYFAPANGFKAGEFDTLKQIVAMGTAFELIERRGAYYDFGGGTWQGAEKLLEAFRSDAKLYRKLYYDVFKAALPDVTPPALPVESEAKPVRKVRRKAE